MIEQKLSNIDIDIYIYEPNISIMENIKSEKVQLTKARALMLYLLFDLVRQGEFVSEFSSEKICYFLQKFGAKDIFNLNFEPKYYGPYSGKVKFVLYVLNGSYILGYNDMNLKPFEPIGLLGNTFKDVQSFILNDKELQQIADKTMCFLDGYYSDFSLELLSSVDYIMLQHGNISNEEIQNHLSQWTNRKSKIFDNVKHIDSARKHLLNNFSY